VWELKAVEPCSVDRGEFAQALLSWYSSHKRALPWRERSGDAYAVWISEIMLQQTTVVAAAPYFERWMRQFPTLDSLANAEMDDVLRMWAGLGYYARARNIKSAADCIARDFNGRVPDTVAALMKLPGIGRYTAGAIASIAYGRHEPVLDANVTRVLARLYALDGAVEMEATRSELWRLSAAAIPAGESSAFNQALMELGALVCEPRAPKCSACPVAAHCMALKRGDPASYPRSNRKVVWLNCVDCCIAVERNNGHFLFIRRPESGSWGGMWELPRATVQEGEQVDECVRRLVRHLANLEIEGLVGFGTCKHTVMNRRVTLHGFRLRVSEFSADSIVTQAQSAWLAADEALARLALPSPQRAILRKLEVARDGAASAHG
jgi:A/G-specific adenine glycosylase